MLFKDLKDYEIKDVDIWDVESLVGALIETMHILDELSAHLDDNVAGLGAEIFEVTTMLDDAIKNIEGRIND